MYTVGLDKCKSFLILFSQNVSTRRENNSNKVLSDSEGVNSDRTPENINQAKEILFGSLLGSPFFLNILDSFLFSLFLLSL
jgi:hypothetical protein